MKYEVVLNETKTRMVKRVVPTNCSPTEVKKEKEDYIEKGKGGSPDQAKRDIEVTKKKTCDLDTKLVDSAEDNSGTVPADEKKTSFKGKGESVPLVQSAEGAQRISVRKDIFDSLMAKAYPEYKDLEETQSPGEYLEKQRERDKELRRKKELNPMLDVEEDFRTMANGVMSEEEEEVEEAKSKKKKPHCNVGNVWHDSEGRLTDKKSAKSFSLQFSKSGSDCVGGVAKMPGQRFTKVPCGRKSKHSTKKAPHKCKDGSPV